MGQGRVELPTSRLSGVRSNHLSYWPSVAAQHRRDEERRHVLACCRKGAPVGSNADREPRSLETEPYAILTIELVEVIAEPSGL